MEHCSSGDALVKSSRTVCFAVLIGSSAIAGGCSAFVTRIQSLPIDPGTSRVLNMNSDRRATYVLWHNDGDDPRNSRHVVVAEPPPDTALQKTVEAIGKLQVTAAPGGDVASGQLGVGVVDRDQILSLTNRTQAVVILRDSLFRLSEARANGFIDKGEWIKLYGKVVDSAKSIAEAEQNLRRASENIRSAVDNSGQQVADMVKTARSIEVAQEREAQNAAQREREISNIQQTIAQQLALLRTEVSTAAEAALKVGGEREQLKLALASMQAKADQVATQLADSSSALAAKIDSAATRVEQGRGGPSLTNMTPVLGNDASPSGQITLLRALRQSTTNVSEQKVIDDIIKRLEAKLRPSMPDR
jgi:hypothetical protein